MLHSIFTILAQSPAPSAGAQAQQGFSPMQFLPILLIGGIFYMLIIRPQSRRQKEQQAMVDAVKTGDKVITSSGIHGIVSNVKDTTVIVKIADNVKVEVEKSSIGTVKRDSAAEPATATAS
jgi:preprotein translocase subunit YajC